MEADVGRGQEGAWGSPSYVTKDQSKIWVCGSVQGFDSRLRVQLPSPREQREEGRGIESLRPKGYHAHNEDQEKRMLIQGCRSMRFLAQTVSPALSV